jgi:hypothetical protein
MKHYDVVAMSMLELGKIKTIYALIMLYDSYSVALNSVLLTPENLPQKKQIAGSIGLDTIVLTNYLKKHYNYIMSQLNLRCVATHYIFITEEDAKNAADYLNDCLLAKEMIK